MEGNSWEDFELETVRFVVMSGGELFPVANAGRDPNGVWFEVRSPTNGAKSTLHYRSSMSTWQWVSTSPLTIEVFEPLSRTRGL